MKLSKHTLTYTRLIHVYVSMALLTLLFFFSVTGITLNHPAWFSEQSAAITEQELQITLPEPPNSEMSKEQLTLVSALVSTELNEAMNSFSSDIDLNKASAEIMDDEIYWGIKSAGENTSITLELDSGYVLFEHTNYGAWAKLNDLHKGRNTTDFWRWILDLSSVLFIVFAITGFMLAMPQRRFKKTVLLSVGTTLVTLIAAVNFA